MNACTKNATVSACAALPTQASTPIRNELIVARRSTARAVPRMARMVLRVSAIGVEMSGLVAEHRRVEATGGDKLGMRSVFHDPTFVEQDDPLRVADAREAVGDQDCGEALGEVKEAIEQVGLGANVELRRRFVEHEDRRAP